MNIYVVLITLVVNLSKKNLLYYIEIVERYIKGNKKYEDVLFKSDNLK